MDPAATLGAIVDEEHTRRVLGFIDRARSDGRIVLDGTRETVDGRGCFIAPTIVTDLAPNAELVTEEVFGPVLHVVRYARDELDGLMAQIRATGYGLTMGLHTRIDETIERVLSSAHVGNVYVNRNMVGAVVGMQPFGGEGLSGTGPKAGGPLYMYRLLAVRPQDVLARAAERGLPSSAVEGAAAPAAPALDSLVAWIVIVEVPSSST